MVVCCKSGCGQEFPRCEEKDHALRCSKREISCSYCSAKLPHDELDIHHQSCPLHPVNCNFCHQQIPTRNEVSQITFLMVILGYYNDVFFLPFVQFSRHLEVCTECELDCPMAKSTQCKFTVSDSFQYSCLSLSIITVRKKKLEKKKE